MYHDYLNYSNRLPNPHNIQGLLIQQSNQLVDLQNITTQGNFIITKNFDDSCKRAIKVKLLLEKL